jgi:thioredoxin-like negative regulator of GroEL
MPIIPQADQDYIRQLFAERLTDDVTVELFTQRRSPILVLGAEECQYCEETRQLLEEVAALSDRIELVVHDVKDEPDAMREHGIEQIPAIVFKGKGKGTMRFFGIPAGNEFRNLIDGIVEVGTGESGLAQPTRDALAALAQDVHLRVFVTPT